MSWLLFLGTATIAQDGNDKTNGHQSDTADDADDNPQRYARDASQRQRRAEARS